MQIVIEDLFWKGLENKVWFEISRIMNTSLIQTRNIDNVVSYIIVDYIAVYLLFSMNRYIVEKIY